LERESQTPLRAGESPRDEVSWRKRRGRLVDYITGTERGECEEKGQTEMLWEERRKENDRRQLDGVGDNHQGGGGRVRDWMDTS